MKKVLLSLILLCSFAAFSQSINDYQYVIVPIKFDFLKENDRYRLNTNTKSLLQKYGFKAYLSNEETPAEATTNRCNVLYASLEKEASMFVTKIKIVLRDCQERVVFESDYGSSRAKDLAPAYNEALREVAKSFEALEYKYNGGKATTVQPIATTVTATPTPTVSTPVPAEPTVVSTEPFFFAQPTANGYQVIDNEPKVIMRLYKTSQTNVFMADKNGVNGTVLIKEGKWVFEHYDNGKLVSESINLKF
jgi:hypothetical protein